jgi:hypothetical protein
MYVTYAVQTIDLSRNETDWTTLPPIHSTRAWDWEVDKDADLDEVAEEIANRREIRFMLNVRGRIAVWRNPEGITFGAGIRTPDGTFEVTR